VVGNATLFRMYVYLHRLCYQPYFTSEEGARVIVLSRAFTKSSVQNIKT